jgi:DNA-binding XRE family transcriptional regulator
MTASVVLKKVREAYPEVFEELSKTKLKLVKNAIIYASQISVSDEVLTHEEHNALLKKMTGVEALEPWQKLKAYRLREDLSQVELAKRCGIPQANLSAMEQGKRTIGVQTAKKLAAALRCDYRQLL